MMGKSKIAASASGGRDPSEREKRSNSAAVASQHTRPARAQFKEGPSADGVMRLAPRHNDQEGHNALVMETFGTTAGAFVDATVLQLANITMRDKKPCLDGLNASLALVGAIAPENELEAALAAQMAATYELSMEMLKRTKIAETRDAMREYGNLATKLSRTFTTQMKALSDWRRGGEQVVRHVHVYDGGQAVVAGTINQGGLQHEITANKPYGKGACGPALLGQDTEGDGMPISSDGERSVPDSRRRDARRGRAKG
jgi:hypothetical protein